MTRVVGGLFLLKGILGILIGFDFFDGIKPNFISTNLWDFLMMLFTEIMPTSVFIFISSSKSTEATLNETPHEENELKTYD